MRAEADWSLAPDMAESWESADPQTYTFKLRQGVKFHHGPEMTSEDALYTHERQYFEGVAAPFRSWLDMVESVETPDDYTITYRLKYPFINFPAVFANKHTGGIVSKQFTEEAGGDLSTTFSGTGPFRVKQAEADARLVLERFPEYWRMGEDGESLPYLDEVIYEMIVEEAALVAAIRTGNILWTQVGTHSADVLEGEDDLVVLRGPQGWANNWTAHPGRAPTDDERVRRALQISIDRPDLITKSVGAGCTDHGHVRRG